MEADLRSGGSVCLGCGLLGDPYAETGRKRRFVNISAEEDVRISSGRVGLATNTRRLTDFERLPVAKDYGS